jgi:hypothetical protein
LAVPVPGAPSAAPVPAAPAVAPVPATPGPKLALELLCVDLAVDDVDQLPVAERRRLLSAAVSAAAEVICRRSSWICFSDFFSAS